jgi:hypothetical protein
MTREFPGVMPWHMYGGDPWMTWGEIGAYHTAAQQIMDERRKADRQARRGR